MNRDARNLRYIIVCIERVEEYTAIGKEALESQLLLDAIERNLEKLADTARHLSEETRSAAPHIAWRSISDFRNILAHQYHGIDYEVVWSIIVNDLPLLKSFARTTLVAFTDKFLDTTGDVESDA